MNDTNYIHVLKSSIVAGSVKLAGSGTLFLLHLLVARQFGPGGLGVFALTIAVLAVSAVLCRLGMDNPVLRATSRLVGRGLKEQLPSLTRGSIAIAGIGGGILALLLWLAAPVIAHRIFDVPEVADGFRVVVPILPFVAMTFMQSQVLRGLGSIWVSQSAVLLIAPLTAIVGILLFPFNDVLTALRAYAVGELVAFAAAALGLAALGQFWWRADRFPAQIRPLLRESAHLYPVSLANIAQIWLPALLLGWLGTEVDVGLFQSAQVVAAFVSFFLSAVNIAAAPRIAMLHSQGQSVELSGLVQKLTALSAIAAIGVCGVILLGSDVILGLFGSEFQIAKPVLIALLVGQFINLASGPVGFVLMMTGHYREFRTISVVGFAILVIGSLAMIPIWGAMGAALSVSASLSFVNIASLVTVRFKLRFWSIWPYRVDQRA